MSKPTDWEVNLLHSFISRTIAEDEYEFMPQEEAERRINAHDGLVEALKLGKMVIEHAIALDHLGEGSTLGMANDALEKFKNALAAAVAKDLGKEGGA